MERRGESLPCRNRLTVGSNEDGPGGIEPEGSCARAVKVMHCEWSARIRERSVSPPQIVWTREERDSFAQQVERRHSLVSAVQPVVGQAAAKVPRERVVHV